MLRPSLVLIPRANAEVVRSVPPAAPAGRFADRPITRMSDGPCPVASTFRARVPHRRAALASLSLIRHAERRFLVGARCQFLDQRNLRKQQLVVIATSSTLAREGWPNSPRILQLRDPRDQGRACPSGATTNQTSSAGRQGQADLGLFNDGNCRPTRFGDLLRADLLGLHVQTRGMKMTSWIIPERKLYATIALTLCAALLTTVAARGQTVTSSAVMWGTTNGAGTSGASQVELAVQHQADGSSAGLVNGAIAGVLLNTGGGSVSIYSIGSQSVVSNTVIGDGNNVSITATQTSSNTGDVTNSGQVGQTITGSSASTNKSAVGAAPLPSGQ